MDLQDLMHRRTLLEQDRINVANNWQLLSGHIAECDYQISLIKKEAETLVVEPVDPIDELVIE